MKITMESTTEIVTINGIRARKWAGVTDTGIPVIVFVPAIAVSEEHDMAEFDSDLIDMEPPAISGMGPAEGEQVQPLETGTASSLLREVFRGRAR